MKGLGISRNGEYYGIDGLGEAKLYVQHPQRLRRRGRVTLHTLIKNSQGRLLRPWGFL
ncbi:MAG: DUF1810 domain-containing protein [Bacteroidales bacterium]|nr:DUF1810 domain-containing protein [Bacteroidales bacterium]